MDQAWTNALLGGGLIGLSATILLLVSGRVTGISGIFFGVLKPVKNDFHWRLMFVLGLLFGGFIASFFLDSPFINLSGRPLTAVVIGGFLVGFGTRLGSGCTSGHGVCGISRLSPRSIAATLTFIGAGIVSVYLISKIIGW